MLTSRRDPTLIILWLAAALLVGLTVFRVAQVLPTHANLNHVSGIWTTLAVDLVHGVFYRPILDPVLGYGGTRYFPLHFVLHAGLIRLGMGPVAAGHTIGIAAIVALIVGTYLLLRELGVSRSLAVPASALVLASTSSQLALLQIRSDSLPAALCVFGLAACARQKPRIVWAAVLFTLAVAAKITAIYGAAAAVAALVLAGQRREGRWLAVLMVIGVAAVGATMYVASEGRVFEIFQACAFAGSTPWGFVRGPIRLASESVLADAPGLPILIFAVAAIASTLAVSWRELPSLTLLAAAAVLAAILGSPGTDQNHLIDLHVAAVVVTTYAISRSRVPALFGVVALALITVAACGEVAFRINVFDASEQNAKRDEMLRAVEGVRGPILSENPLLPLLAGQRPYLLDPFLIRMARERDPRVTADLWRNLETRKFGAVVVYSRQDEDIHFGPGFYKKLAENYELEREILGYSLYLPRREENK